MQDAQDAKRKEDFSKREQKVRILMSRMTDTVLKDQAGNKEHEEQLFLKYQEERFCKKEKEERNKLAAKKR